MNIEIESRRSIIKRAEKGFTFGTVLFSICDTDTEAPKLVRAPEYHYVMAFNDVDGDVFFRCLQKHVERKCSYSGGGEI